MHSLACVLCWLKVNYQFKLRSVAPHSKPPASVVSSTITKKYCRPQIASVIASSLNKQRERRFVAAHIRSSLLKCLIWIILVFLPLVLMSPCFWACHWPSNYFPSSIYSTSNSMANFLNRRRHDFFRPLTGRMFSCYVQSAAGVYATLGASYSSSTSRAKRRKKRFPLPWISFSKTEKSGLLPVYIYRYIQYVHMYVCVCVRVYSL